MVTAIIKVLLFVVHSLVFSVIITVDSTLIFVVFPQIIRRTAITNLSRINPSVSINLLIFHIFGIQILCYTLRATRLVIVFGCKVSSFSINTIITISV